MNMIFSDEEDFDDNDNSASNFTDKNKKKTYKKKEEKAKKKRGRKSLVEKLRELEEKKLQELEEEKKRKQGFDSFLHVLKEVQLNNNTQIEFAIRHMNDEIRYEHSNMEDSDVDLKIRPLVDP